jgi:2,4-dienoyl-CoA reductase-like NADH-dependent reductase (Old Yellow Enzyme family)
MKTLTANKLFTPIQVGPMELKHRVVMGPLTRSRSVQPGNIPGDLMLEYYSQRASGGGLIVSEATSISVAGGGWFACQCDTFDHRWSGGLSDRHRAGRHSPKFGGILLRRMPLMN